MALIHSLSIFFCLNGRIKNHRDGITTHTSASKETVFYFGS
jgi:hypothetical protein